MHWRGGSLAPSTRRTSCSIRWQPFMSLECSGIDSCIWVPLRSWLLNFLSWSFLPALVETRKYFSILSFEWNSVCVLLVIGTTLIIFLFCLTNHSYQCFNALTETVTILFNTNCYARVIKRKPKMISYKSRIKGLVPFFLGEFLGIVMYYLSTWPIHDTCIFYQPFGYELYMLLILTPVTQS